MCHFRRWEDRVEELGEEGFAARSNEAGDGVDGVLCLATEGRHLCAALGGRELVALGHHDHEGAMDVIEPVDELSLFVRESATPIDEHHDESQRGAALDVVLDE